MTKVFNDGPDHRVGKVVSRLSRKDMTLFIHAITGHNNLNYMNRIIIPNYTPLCRFCEEEDESFQHLYEETKNGNTRRQDWCRKLDSTGLALNSRTLLFPSLLVIKTIKL